MKSIGISWSPLESRTRPAWSPPVRVRVSERRPAKFSGGRAPRTQWPSYLVGPGLGVLEKPHPTRIAPVQARDGQLPAHEGPLRMGHQYRRPSVAASETSHCGRRAVRVVGIALGGLAVVVDVLERNQALREGPRGHCFVERVCPSLPVGDGNGQERIPPFLRRTPTASRSRRPG